MIALTRLSIQCSKSRESVAYKGEYEALLKVDIILTGKLSMDV